MWNNSDIKHRMTRRLNDWDYCQRAIYSIVVSLQDRSREWLGKLAKNGEPQDKLAKNGEPQDSGWCIQPSGYGLAVLEALDEMPRLYPQVQILARQLMPEHFHFVIFVTAPLPKPLGQLIRGFKVGAAKRWKMLAKNGEPQNLLAKNGEPQNLLANNGEKQDMGRPVAGHYCPEWSDGFQDTVLLYENQLDPMIRYVLDNPRRLAERRANPELFRRVADLALPLDNGRIIGHFSAIGNRHLLERPLVQVQCSRRYLAYRRIPKPGGGMKIARDAAGAPLIENASPEYADIRDGVLAAATHGAVVISPCISDGERQIAREAFERALPLVVLRNKGFGPMQKPQGRFFDSCSEGRLLMVAPAAWPYTTQEKPMTRLDATALNRITQWLVASSAARHYCQAPINYHGMTPNDIDKIAEEAVQAWRSK